MKEKIRSLVFLISFIICAIIYFQIEQNEKKPTNEKSRFVSIEIESDINNEEFDDIPDIIIKNDSLK